MDAVKSDFEDDLADVMENSGTELVVDNELKDDDKDEDQEVDTSILDTNQILLATVYNSTKDDNTGIQDGKINESFNIVDSAAKSKDDSPKEIH